MSAINMTTQFEGQTMLLTEEKEKKNIDCQNTAQKA